MITSKYHATQEDGAEILRILESSAAKGQIELIYTRRPDAYESYMKEDGQTTVFVSKKQGRTVGTCAKIVREVYIGGEACRAAYVCGLKKDAAYEGGVGFGAGFIRDLQQDGVDFYYCSVVSDNVDAQKMFESSRRVISMTPISGYKTYIINPAVKIKTPKNSLTFRRATQDDTVELIDFLNAEGKKRDMFPVVRSIEQFHGLKTQDFYLLKDGASIVASAALWKQTDYKQYIVKRYGSIMKLARVFNPLLSALGYIKLPKQNKPLEFPMLAFFICHDDSEYYYRVFLNEIKREIAKRYGMFVIGLPRDHFATPMLDKLPSISFETKLYEIRFPWSEQAYKAPDTKNAFFECGLL